MKNIEDFVINKPLPPLETNEQKGFCPYCNSKNIKENGTKTTLVGFFGYWDGNHRWTACCCNDCGKSFTREVKGNNEWYTSVEFPRIVLSGFPSCFENYIYKCSCGGKIKIKHLELNSDKEVFGLCSKNIDGKYIKQYRDVIICDSCDLKEEIDHYYWEGYSLKDDRDEPFPKPDFLKKEIGAAFYNPNALKKLRIER